MMLVVNDPGGCSADPPNHLEKYLSFLSTKHEVGITTPPPYRSIKGIYAVRVQA